MAQNAVNIPLPVSVANGGVGTNSLTDHGLLVGSGISAITALTVGATGEVLTGSTGADPVWSATPNITSISFDGGSNNLSTYIAGGTFTPTLAFGGASTGIVYVTQTGLYTRIGDIVWVIIRIVLSNKGTATGNATVEGLPITSSNQPAYFTGFLNFVTYAANAYPVAEVTASSTSILMRYESTGSTTTTMTNASIANNSQIQFSGLYRV